MLNIVILQLLRYWEHNRSDSTVFPQNLFSVSFVKSYLENSGTGNLKKKK